MRRVQHRWERELRQRITPGQLFRKHREIAEARGLTEETIGKMAASYPIAITPHYAKLIDWGNPDDPLMRIVFPDSRELAQEGLGDQSGEWISTSKTGVRGLQHKYESTALMMVAGTCASYCRYCFRRRVVGTDKETATDLEAALEYIRAHEEINNVLLTGGDAFMAGNSRLAEILGGLRKIGHVGVIRLGTKMPVYLPSRFSDPELLKVLEGHSSAGKRICVISHIDHPRELDAQALEAHARLMGAGVHLRSQSVLMRGVNDSPGTLVELFRKVADAGIAPYYLFQCRPVRGGTHFALPLVEAHGIVEEAKRHLSGLAKSFRFIMSHVSGKIEVVSVEVRGERKLAIFKYHQARDPEFLGKSILVAYARDSFWLDDVLGQPHEIVAGRRTAEYAKGQSRLLAAGN
ncbi:MAG: KamA family radical SAM protein [Candidatus Micrarchaeia archaeon]|jgi:L-lysine 2,3-aminomutase